ncbi:hypothetical protein HZS_4367 [Henneguya salminicola]|nr:hypothetical protein HZS_4367 [Henneguya salminicola]
MDGSYSNTTIPNGITALNLFAILLSVPFSVLFVIISGYCIHLLIYKYNSLHKSFLLTANIVFALTIEYIGSILPRLLSTYLNNMNILECQLINMISLSCFSVVSMGILFSFMERYVSIKTDLSLQQMLFRKEFMKYYSIGLWVTPMLVVLTMYPSWKKIGTKKYINYRIAYCLYSSTQHVFITIIYSLLFPVITSFTSIYVGYLIIEHIHKHHARLRLNKLKTTVDIVQQELKTVKRIKLTIIFISVGIFLINTPLSFFKRKYLPTGVLTAVNIYMILCTIYELFVIIYYEKKLFDYLY